MDEITKGEATTYLYLPLLAKLKNKFFLGMPISSLFVFANFIQGNAIAAIDDRVLINLRNIKQLMLIDELNANGI